MMQYLMEFCVIYVRSAFHILTTIAQLDIMHISTMHMSHRLRKSIKHCALYEHGVLSWRSSVNMF